MFGVVIAVFLPQLLAAHMPIVLKLFPILSFTGVDITYLIGLVAGSIIPDLDHHNSVLNRRALIILDIVIKLNIVGGLAIYLLRYQPSLSPVIKLSVIAISSLIIYNFKFNKKWCLKLLYALIGISVVLYFGLSVRSVFLAVIIVMIGYFPHRGFTHKWYGLGLISIGVFLVFGGSMFFVGVVVGMVGHVGGDVLMYV